MFATRQGDVDELFLVAQVFGQLKKALMVIVPFEQ
jgi:hypothetical protein